MTATKEWFATWFDTEYYHKLYNNRDYTEAERFINNLMSHLNLRSESYVLDLACGKGRHALQLNKLGYDVKGVDLSENSIEYAQEFANDKLQFAVQDMRYPLVEKFDAILNLFTSFGYFESTDDNFKVMHSISNMLWPTGVFVIDFMNAEKVINNLIPNATEQREDLTFNITRKFDGNHIFKNIEVIDSDKTKNYQERVQSLKLEDFKSIIEDTELIITDVFGDYDLNSFDPESSDRLIIIGRKE